MRIESVDPQNVDDATVARLADLENLAGSADAPFLPAVTPRSVQLRQRYGNEGEPLDYLLLAIDEDGSPVGRAEVELAHWDNPHLAVVDLVIDPARLSGVGTALLRETESLVTAAGRTLLLTDAWRGSAGADFLAAAGFELGMSSAMRRLVLADLDRDRLGRLLAESERASADYDLEVIAHPAPDDLVPGLLDLHLAMNDSPLDSLALEDDVWNEARLRAFEQTVSAREFRLYHLVARRRSDGVVGGHTVVIVEEDRPWFAFQEDTAVISGHRGHRLGMRLKVSMLELLAKEEPQLQFIDTWNAESNAHMLAVNDTMGYVVLARAVEVQKHLPTSTD